MDPNNDLAPGIKRAPINFNFWTYIPGAVVLDPAGKPPWRTQARNRKMHLRECSAQIGRECCQQVLLAVLAMPPPALSAGSPIAILTPDKRDRWGVASLSRPGFGGDIEWLDSREPLNSEFGQKRVR